MLAWEICLLLYILSLHDAGNVDDEADAKRGI